jgi:carbon monoxide dehydrogenase subunit G
VRFTFPVEAPAAAWTALATPEGLAAALPGCRSVTVDPPGGDGDGVGGGGGAVAAGRDDGGGDRGGGGGGAVGDGGTLHLVMDLSVASVRGLWAGTVVRVDADSLRVVGSGEPGTVDVVVRADPGRTVLTVEGTVGGALATVGSAVLAAAVRRLVDDSLAAAARPPASPEPPASPAPAASAATAAGAPRSRGTGFRPPGPEAMGSGSGTYDLAPGSTEPDASEPGASEGPDASEGAASLRRTGPVVAAAVAAVTGLAAVVVFGRRRAAHRGAGRGARRSPRG